MSKSLVSQDQVDLFHINMTDLVQAKIVDLGIRTLLTKQIKKHGGILEDDFITKMASGEFNPFARTDAASAGPKLNKRDISVIERYVLRKIIAGEAQGMDAQTMMTDLAAAVTTELAADKTSPTLANIKAYLA